MPIISTDQVFAIQLEMDTSRNSSVGRALDWRSKGPWFNPGFRHGKSGGWYFFQPESARQEQLLLCSKTSGHLEESAWEPNSASSTPMWSQSCFTDVRHGGQHRRCNERSRHSSTPVWGASTKSSGNRWASGTGTSGQADTAEEVGLDRTHPQEASIQHHTLSPDLEPAREEEERPASQQLEARHWSRAETAGDQLVRNDKSRTEYDGGGSLMAYAPLGARGISK